MKFLTIYSFVDFNCLCLITKEILGNIKLILVIFKGDNNLCNTSIKSNISVIEQKLYSLRKNLKDIYQLHGDSSGMDSLMQQFDIKFDEISPKNYLLIDENWDAPSNSMRLSSYTLHCTGKYSSDIHEGDYVKIIDNPLDVYRVVAFRWRENDKLALVLMKMYENTLAAPFRTFEEALPASVNIIKKSALRHFKPRTELYHKLKTETGWKVKSLKISLWGQRFDTVTCTKGTLEETVSILDVIPYDERVCWNPNCRLPVHPEKNLDCEECRWFICNCIPGGACGCHTLGYRKQTV